MALRRQTVIAPAALRRAEVEQLFWRALGTSDLRWKFRRQHPIGRHLADFACPARKLAIELDGGQHALAFQADNDRSAEMEAAGYRVLRFWNNEVLENLEGVLEALRLAPDAPHLTPTLSAPGGGLGRGLRPSRRVN
jgi:very-short-patch-repair endonuclease